MNKSEIISFFDEMSDDWDLNMIKKPEVVEQILDYAEVKSGITVLDVACGTGCLIPDYMNRKVRKVVGVDISSKMIAIAKKKFKENQEVEFCVGDMEELRMDEKFDSIVVYNAFPHFCNPRQLIENISRHLVDGGILCVAHGMSRAQIDACHGGQARQVSKGLIHEDEMEKLFEPYFKVNTKISNQEMYVVTGQKK